jgi:ATP-dependent Lhr-like helicase
VIQAAKPSVEDAIEIARRWFASRGWSPFAFQEQAWRAYLEGRSGLIYSTTGSGKTHAAWLGAVAEFAAGGASSVELPVQAEPQISSGRFRIRPLPKKRLKRDDYEPLRVLWITPLRALSVDTAQAMLEPVRDLELPWSVETRTGDTSSSLRQRQKQRLPTALVTTPESLCLLLTYPETQAQFQHLSLVVVDEWHELLSSKRGVQVELALARLRRWRPQLCTWGLSATLGDVREAMNTLLADSEGELIEGESEKTFQIDSVVPESVERFPWAGHLGLKQLADVLTAIDAARTSLVFTNTRSQAEQWYQAILKGRPDWAGQLALHHGSIDQETRRWVEDRLRAGKLKAVVCTSSLDLGVDFQCVERVLQVGSPKGVARLLQRAGRSGHQPGEPSRVICVPTHALELVEVAAAREAVEHRQLESRPALRGPIDVLIQHAVTIACGDGFRADDLYDEVRRTSAYRDLTPNEWQWVLDFITHGGDSLRAYPDYHRVEHMADGTFRVTNPRLARLHRSAIGTIVGDTSLTVQYLRGQRLGTVEESFITRLKPGDRFTFAGKTLELVRVYEMKAIVRRSRANEARVPRWYGGRMPLSSQLAEAVRRKLEEARGGKFVGREMQAVRPLLELQDRWSAIPAHDELLIERITTRDGHHLFMYPFAGRLVHEGLAALWAYRLSRHKSTTFSMTVNDYGLELLSADEPPLDAAIAAGLFQVGNLAADIVACLNEVEMARRQFREIARIAGLIFEGYPGSRKTTKQLQASSGLLYDVFREYDPQNRLLLQAHSEVLDRQLEFIRLRSTLERLEQTRLVITEPERLPPLAFPLWVDRTRERVSSETLAERIRKMQTVLERAAGEGK